MHGLGNSCDRELLKPGMPCIIDGEDGTWWGEVAELNDALPVLLIVTAKISGGRFQLDEKLNPVRSDDPKNGSVPNCYHHVYPDTETTRDLLHSKNRAKNMVALLVKKLTKVVDQIDDLGDLLGEHLANRR